jgi:hypothetical protein
LIVEVAESHLTRRQSVDNPYDRGQLPAGRPQPRARRADVVVELVEQPGLQLELLADRQIAPDPDLVPWIVARMHRSLAAAGAVVAALDARSLARGRPVARALAAEVLEELAEGMADAR